MVQKLLNELIPLTLIPFNVGRQSALAADVLFLTERPGCFMRTSNTPDAC